MKKSSKLTDEQIAVNRWRLVLGSKADRSLPFEGNDRDLKALGDMEELRRFHEQLDLIAQAYKAQSNHTYDGVKKSEDR